MHNGKVLFFREDPSFYRRRMIEVVNPGRKLPDLARSNVGNTWEQLGFGNQDNREDPSFCRRRMIEVVNPGRKIPDLARSNVGTRNLSNPGRDARNPGGGTTVAHLSFQSSKKTWILKQFSWKPTESPYLGNLDHKYCQLARETKYIHRLGDENESRSPKPLRNSCSLATADQQHHASS